MIMINAAFTRRWFSMSCWLRWLTSKEMKTQALLVWGGSSFAGLLQVIWVAKWKKSNVTVCESSPWPCLVAVTVCSRNLVLSKIKTPIYFFSGIERRNIASYYIATDLHLEPPDFSKMFDQTLRTFSIFGSKCLFSQKRKIQHLEPFWGYVYSKM